MPSFSDAFSGPVMCAPWGTPTCTEASCTESGGLAIAPNPGMTTTAGCAGHSPVQFADAGIFVEVPSIVTGPTARTQLEIDGSGGQVTQLTMAVENGQIIGQELDTGMSTPAMLYDGMMMRWWRVRPDNGGSTTRLDVSHDGLTWQPLGELALAPGGTVFVTLGVDTTPADTSPGMTIFRNLDVCP